MNYPLPDDLFRICADLDTACVKTIFTEITQNPNTITNIVLTYPPCPRTRLVSKYESSRRKTGYVHTNVTTQTERLILQLPEIIE